MDLKKITIDSSKILLFSGVNIVVSVISSVVFARVLGVEYRGDFALIVAFINIVSTVFSFGVPAAILYFNRLGIMSYEYSIRVISVLTFFVGLVLTILLLWFYQDIQTYLKIESTFAIISIYISICGTIILTSLGTLMISLDKHLKYSLMSIYRNLSLLVLFVFLVFFNMASVVNALYCYLISIFIGIVFSHFSIRLEKNKVKSHGKENIKSIISYAFGYYPGNLSGTFNNYGVLLVINHFFSNVEVGIFSVVQSIINMVNTFMRQVFGFFTAQLIGKSKENKRYLFKFMLKIILIVLLPISFAIFYFGTDVIVLVYGDEYKKSGEMVEIMVISVLFLVVSTLNSEFFNSIGKSMVGSYISIFYSVFLAVLLSIFSYIFGFDSIKFAFVLSSIALFIFSTTLRRFIWGKS